jgi:hypothetical protein
VAALCTVQIHCEKVTTGSVRRTINCLCFSADGAWLFAGTASGDVLTVNVARKAVQVRSPRCRCGPNHVDVFPVHQRLGRVCNCAQNYARCLRVGAGPARRRCVCCLLTAGCSRHARTESWHAQTNSVTQIAILCVTCRLHQCS